ncbi:hypothetical protein HAX54_049742 [Datura stramonium]|uniref:Uncharacterized protein n=1 Tax=Datura stramonium TaxID=4076 RepID=A0ABS8SVP3_DATST|nr:hypothetical protein [Datura stramonium]
MESGVECLINEAIHTYIRIDLIKAREMIKNQDRSIASHQNAFQDVDDEMELLKVLNDMATNDLSSTENQIILEKNLHI